MLTQLALYLLLGALTGVLAGLFGVGGGIIIVPALVFSLTLQGVSPAVLTHVAIGSSLATICLTSLSSVRAHHRRGAVRWQLVWQLAPGVCVGVWSGAALAHLLSGATLQKGFGIFLLLIGAQMWRSQPASGENNCEQHLPSVAATAIIAVLIGVVSALFGIGGGSLTVPFLHRYGVRMQQAVATAAAVGFPIALVGACGYAWQGWGNPQLPAHSSGFIHWPAVLGIAAASVFSASSGAAWAHRLDAQKLKRYFALLLIAIGVWFLLRG